MTLPADVSRCQPAGLCLRRMRCARFVEPADEHTPVTAFEPTGCEAFIPADDGARSGNPYEFGNGSVGGVKFAV